MRIRLPRPLFRRDSAWSTGGRGCPDDGHGRSRAAGRPPAAGHPGGLAAARPRRRCRGSAPCRARRPARQPTHACTGPAAGRPGARLFAAESKCGQSQTRQREQRAARRFCCGITGPRRHSSAKHRPDGAETRTGRGTDLLRTVSLRRGIGGPRRQRFPGWTPPGGSRVLRNPGNIGVDSGRVHGRLFKGPSGALGLDGPASYSKAPTGYHKGTRARPRPQPSRALASEIRVEPGFYGRRVDCRIEVLLAIELEPLRVGAAPGDLLDVEQVASGDVVHGDVAAAGAA